MKRSALLLLLITPLVALASGSTLLAQTPRVIVHVITPDAASQPTVPLANGRWGIAEGLLGSQSNPIPVQESSTVLLLIGDTELPGIPPGDSRVRASDPLTKFPAPPSTPVLEFGGNTASPSGKILGWDTWGLNQARAAIGVVTFEETSPDFDPATDSLTVEVWFARTVIFTNSNPQVSAGSDRAVSFGELVTLNGSATDPDGDNLSFSWVQLANTTSQVQLTGANTPSPSFTAPSQPATLEFKLTVTDGNGGQGMDNVKIFVTATGGGNPPPDGGSEIVCPATELQAGNVPATGSVTQGTVTIEGSPVFLTATGNDPDNSTSGNIPVAGVGFTWEVVDGKGVLNNQDLSADSDSGTSQLTFTAPQVGVDTIVTLAVTITDPRGCGVRITTNVKIQDTDGGGGPVNSNPTVQVGADFQVSKGEQIELPGQGSDADGDVLSFSWEQISGPAVVLSGQNTPTTSFTVPLSSDTGAVIVLRLTASDNKGGQASDDISLEILDNRVPRVTVAPEQLVNSGAVASLMAVGEDDDVGDVLTYSWSQVDGPAVEITDADAAEASFSAPEVTEEQGLISLTFKIEVSDGTAKASTTHRVDVKFLVLNSIFFPSTVQGFSDLFANTFVGIAVLNPNGNGNDVGITALAGDGATVEEGQGQALSASGQKAFLSTEVVSGAALNDSRLLRARGDAGPVQGFFLIGDGANRLDGVGGGGIESESMYFTIAREGSNRTTLYYIVNPSEDETANVTVTLFDPNGVEAASVTNDIPPLGAAAGTLQQFFFPDNPDVEVADGYVVVQSNPRMVDDEELPALPLRGFAVGATETDYESQGGQLPVQTKTLLVPHFFVDAGAGDTEIRLFNADATAVVTVNINGFDDDSQPIGEVGVFQVQPRQVVSVSLKEVLNIDTSVLQPGQIITGFAELKMSASAVVFQKTPLVIGSLTFTGNGGAFRSTLPLIEKGRTETLFLHIAQSSAISFFTGLAILNPSKGATATVIVEAYDEAGLLTGTNMFQIPPGQREVDLLDGPNFFLQGFEQLQGHFRVISDLEVVPIALFGNFQGTLMAAIEGQAPIQ